VLGAGEADGQRVFTAARRFCAAVLTSPREANAPDTVLVLGLAARLLAAVLSLASAEFSELVWACHWLRASSTKVTRAALTSVRSAMISVAVPGA
jgi:hypothetical protein